MGIVSLRSYNALQFSLGEREELQQEKEGEASEAADSLVLLRTEAGGTSLPSLTNASPAPLPNRPNVQINTWSNNRMQCKSDEQGQGINSKVVGLLLGSCQCPEMQSMTRRYDGRQGREEHTRK